ncbi:MAG: dihydroorotate dehydrogenase electron transfer subunit [Lachnospiraceae bacterium]|nr:dihydroorotate dehydrogenase electron transfer subunit [Lachnospiraceae bacterium]
MRTENARIIDIRKLAENVFGILFEAAMAGEAGPGQFVMVRPHSDSRLLMRPISICDLDSERRLLRLVFRVAGKGTEEFSRARVGDHYSIMGPLGNGFPLEAAAGKSHIALMGGGIGAPPLLNLLRMLRRRADRGDISARISVYLGYRSMEDGLFLKDEFEPLANVVVSTDDGSAGVKGTALDGLSQAGTAPDLIYACGPLPMLSAIRKYASKEGIDAYISLEERMACGVGACLGCMVKTTKEDHHSHVKLSRICTEGPVFLSRDVEI